MKYKVVIEETVCDEFEVIADSIEEAKEIAVNDYCEGNIVLESGEVQNRKMKVINEQNNDQSDWNEF